jgi:membrane-associated protease RseP (regulator of RpoE activity)
MMIKMRFGGWIFLVACFLCIYRRFPLGESAELAILFVISMLLHELGHALAAWYYRAPVHELGLCLMGGYIRYERPSNSLYHAVILSSGMMANLLLTIPCWFIPHVGPLVSVWNLILFISSVIPLPWFDGGKLLRLCVRQP